MVQASLACLDVKLISLKRAIDSRPRGGLAQDRASTPCLECNNLIVRQLAESDLLAYRHAGFGTRKMIEIPESKEWESFRLAILGKESFKDLNRF